MSDESLKVIGVSNALHRAKILATIAKKRWTYNPSYEHVVIAIKTTTFPLVI
jgi:hypothetical protein